MRKFIILPILFFAFYLPKTTLAQTEDNFTDGNITENPVWVGDDSLFIVNSLGQLQSKGKAGTSGEMFLSTTFNPLTEMEWRFWVKLAYNPSSQNVLKFYLSANQANLKNPLNGYFLQFGGSTGSTDSICLYKQSGMQKIPMILGRPATLGKTSNTLRILVQYNSKIGWSVFSDTACTGQWKVEGNHPDTSIISGNYLGPLLKYTSSNINGTFLDEIYAGPPILDQTSPFLKKIVSIDSLRIQLSFSEKVKFSSNSIQLNGNPYQDSTWFSSDSAEVVLVLSEPLAEDKRQYCHLISVKDPSGNNLDTVITFFYHKLVAGDILISEWMADPDPPLLLPEAEFIELYNHTGVALWLNGLFIGDANQNYSIPEMYIDSGEFVIVCQAKDSMAFNPFGKVCSLPAFPSLNNTSDDLKLKTANGTILNQLNFDLDWYQNSQKQNGGWSIELTNPNQTCKGKSNYLASNDSKGGTPGKVNSNWSTTKDLTAPIILSINPLEKKLIAINFDEPVFLNPFGQTESTLNGKPISSIRLNNTEPNEILIEPQDSMVHLALYNLEIKQLADCAGNLGNPIDSFRFMECRAAKQNDLLIHEIYFDENRKGNFPNGEFIELYNRSEYAINLSNYTLEDATTKSSPFDPIQLMPDSFIIICGNSNTSEFSKMAKTLGVTNFPTLNSSETLTLKDSLGFIVHQIAYQSSWFSKNQKLFSCSMEMKDPNNPCGGQENWDACMDNSGATPGKRNSINGKQTDEKNPSLISHFIQNRGQVLLTFNEQLDSLSLLKNTLFSIEPIGQPESICFYKGRLNQLQLRFASNFDSSLIYSLSIEGIKDCALNPLSKNPILQFQLPRMPQKGDLLLNEILFNPKPAEYDFVELYNSTDFPLDLSSVSMYDVSPLGEKQNISTLSDEPFLIEPKTFLCISEDPKQLQGAFPLVQTNQVITHSLPTLNDDKGTIVFSLANGEVLDSFSYQEAYHLPFLYDPEGVSLEKINANLGSENILNWSSASESSGFGTPTYKNSQDYKAANLNGTIQLARPYFSPDMDGLEDQLIFTYNLSTSKTICNLTIYNTIGELVKTLCKSKILDARGEIFWNGADDFGNKAPIGQYIVLWQLFHETGLLEEKKLSFSLLGK